MGTPLIIAGGTAGTWAPGTIKDAQTDVAFDLSALRRLCLPSSDPANTADYTTTTVYKARLSSDVYNHAYQNSDFSPYAGQQPEHISQNLQASCILKMTANNFGELGKQYMAKTANEARSYANKIDKKARNLIRTYETMTNNIINALDKEGTANTKSQDTLKAETPPANAVLCDEWRDLYSRVVGGRLRGVDKTGRYCPQNTYCLCTKNCHSTETDAYCAEMEPKEGDTTGLLVKKEGTDTPRIGPYSPQETETCFRCAEVGSTKTKRQNTNTYIPSFEVHDAANVEIARQYVAPRYLKHGFVTDPATGRITKIGDSNMILQIYMAVLSEMWAEFKDASTGAYLEKYYKNKYDKLDIANNPEALEPFKFTYRGPVLKDTTATLSDANGGVDQQFRKLDADGQKDKGYYSAAKAWSLQSRTTGSSTAVPNTDGPLLNANGAGMTVPASVNNNDGKPSGGGTTLYKIPPTPESAGNCQFSNQDVEGDITPEGVDMDGLNRDADCDSDEVLEADYAAWEADCAANTTAADEAGNDAYTCDEYVEPECHIEGENVPAATQLFTNDPNAVAAAAGVVPSMMVALFSMLLLAIQC